MTDTDLQAELVAHAQGRSGAPFELGERKRFWAKVEKTSTCWLWKATTDSKGYGRFRTRDRIWAAHRFSYTDLVGPIPPGLVLDHLCRTRDCVNPDHLEPVSNRENILRGESLHAIAWRRGSCERGHERTEENTYITPSGHRECKKCRRIRDAARRDRDRADRGSAQR